MTKIKQLLVTEVEYIAFSLAREELTYNEPIPDFVTRSPHILESCLLTPFQQFGGSFLYKGLVEKTAVLFYLMIKNHPFKNGNKRIAMTTLLVFLYQNKKWIRVDTKELYNFAVWVAESNVKLKKETVQAINTFIKSYIVDL